MVNKCCNVCKETKQLNCFPKMSSGKYGVGQRCKVCVAKITAEYRKSNYLTIYANKYKTNVEHIKSLLAITKCQICGKTANTQKRLCIDHNHKTNKIRSMLCDECNNGLGKFKDNKQLLQNAINYLKEYDD